MTKAPPGPADYALLALLAAIWGGSFMLIKIALEGYGPATLTAARLWIAAVLMWVIAMAAGRRTPWSRQDIATLALVGLFGNALPFVLISWGQQTVDAGLAAILMGIMPILTLVLAHFYADGERMTGAKLTGVVIGLGGLVILVGPALLLDLGRDGIAQLAILAAATSYAVNAILTKRLLHLPRRTAAAALLFVAALMMSAVALAFEDPLSSGMHIRPLVAIALLGVFPTALAALLMFELLQRQGAAFFGQVNLLVPPAGVAWAFVVLGEVPGWAAFAALALILTGILFARGRTGAAARAATLPNQGLKQ